MNRALQLSHSLVERIAARLSYGTSLWEAPTPQPPGPLGSVLLGNMVEGWNHPIELFLRCAEAYGPITRLRFGSSFYYLINEPEMVRHVLVDNYRNYKKSRNYQGFTLFLGDGLFTSEGDYWRKQRKLVQPAFHRERLAGFAETMSASTRELLTDLKDKAEKPIFLDREMARLALRIVCRTLFSAEVDTDEEALREAVDFANEFGESAFFLPTWLPTPKNQKLKKALSIFDQMAYRMINTRRGREGKDLLSMLMAVKDEATGEGMNDTQLRDEALTLILGGHETTATVLSWVFYLLSLHPQIERRLYQHVVSVLGERDPTAEDASKLSYTTQVIQEAMRLYPPAWVMERETLGEDQLGGYSIPKGATVAVCPYVLHRRPDLWPNPEGFDPERFTPELVKERSRYSYLPFGVGPRHCIGNAFGMMETVIIVSMLVRDFRFELVPGHRVTPEPMTTLRLKGGLRMLPRARKETNVDPTAKAQASKDV